MTLALSIINPALLYVGAALASVPVIIHLLNRLRYRRVIWAAMEFLLAAHRKNARRVRLEHLILLILRTLIVLLLAAALGRPILGGLLARLGRSAIHRVIVIDDSFSTQARYGISASGETVIKEIRKTAEWLVKTFDERDGVSLLTAGSKPLVRHETPVFNQQQTLEKLDQISGSDSATDMVGALTAVKRIVDESKQEQKIVYVLTDNAKAAWHDESGKELRNVASSIAEKAGLVVIDLGRTSRPNLAIRTLYPERPVVTTNVLSALRVEVENLGDEPADSVVVNMSVDGEQVSPLVVGRIDARKTETRKWTHVFDRPGEHGVVASLKDAPQDMLLPDSRRFLAVHVKEALNVLLVDGDPKPGPFQNETDYLRAALDPRGPAEERETIFLTRTIRDSELDAADFDELDVVVLANVGSLNEEQNQRLRRFVNDGGSLVVFLGDQVRLQEYNRDLYDNGMGVLPAALAGTLGETGAMEDAKFTGFDVRHFDHPALAAFKEHGRGAGLDTVRVFKYFVLKPAADDKNTSVVLHLGDGNPGIVEKRVGRGRVILWATTADADWSNFPKLPGYLELVHELMDYMMPDVLWRYNRLVDSETVIPVSAGQSRQTVTLSTPTQASIEVRAESMERDRFALVLKDLRTSGLYKLDMGRGGMRLLAVNVDTRESNLDHLTKSELSDRLGQAPFVLAEGREGLVQAMEAQQAAGGWARNLLYAMLALLVAETFLAWFFNRGR